jgi:hypothetical protein
MNGAGLEKWMPRKRSGCTKSAARSPIGRVEVLLPIPLQASRGLDTAQDWALDLRPFEYRLLDEVRFGDRLGNALGARRFRTGSPSPARTALGSQILGLSAKSLEMARREVGSRHDHHIHPPSRRLGRSTHVPGRDGNFLIGLVRSQDQPHPDSVVC